MKNSVMYAVRQAPVDNQQPNLELTVAETAGAVSIQFRGRANIASVAKLQSTLNQVAKRRPALVIFDLSNLDDLCTLAVAAMILFRRSIVRAGGDARLAPLGPKPGSVIENHRLLDWFSFCD